jgi:LPS O-antigen subunit length determinant protein (WzzB/FepE family)
MTVAVWIIAICEVARMVQNAIQLLYLRKEDGNRENAYKEFVKSLNRTDSEFVQSMLKEVEKRLDEIEEEKDAEDNE